jgi:hypothetical protein
MLLSRCLCIIIFVLPLAPLVRCNNLVLLNPNLMLLVVDLDDLERLLGCDDGKAPSQQVSIELS